MIVNRFNDDQVQYYRYAVHRNMISSKGITNLLSSEEFIVKLTLFYRKQTTA